MEKPSIVLSKIVWTIRIELSTPQHIMCMSKATLLWLSHTSIRRQYTTLSWSCCGFVMPKANVSKHWCSIWAPSTIHNVLSLPPPSSNNTGNMVPFDGDNTQCHHHAQSSPCPCFTNTHARCHTADRNVVAKWWTVDLNLSFIIIDWWVLKAWPTNRPPDGTTIMDDNRDHTTTTTNNDDTTQWDAQHQPQSTSTQMMTNTPKQAWTDAHTYRSSCHHHENHQRLLTETRCHIAVTMWHPNTKQQYNTTVSTPPKQQWRHSNKAQHHSLPPNQSLPFPSISPSPSLSIHSLLPLPFHPFPPSPPSPSTPAPSIYVVLMNTFHLSLFKSTYHKEFLGSV